MREVPAAVRQHPEVGQEDAAAASATSAPGETQPLPLLVPRPGLGLRLGKQLEDGPDAVQETSQVDRQPF